MYVTKPYKVPHRLIQISGALPQDVVTALATDTGVFPARDIELTEARLGTSTGKPIEFGRGQDKIEFAAAASASAGLGIYRTPEALRNKLSADADDFSMDALNFGTEPGCLFGAIRWDYDAEAKGSGAMALGAVGKATLSISGNKGGFFAVIRRIPDSTPARSVVQDVADSWIMPRQVVSIDQLSPGTWIISEVVGGLQMQLGAQLGYDFNWVREAELGGLSGDIGLRLQMGINAAIGFSASGRCSVVISRETDAKNLRLQLFRLNSRGFSASLNASLEAKNVGGAWLTLSTDPRADVYQRMSRAIQASLKRHIHDSIFSSPDAYSPTSVAYIILAYCAIPPLAKVPTPFSNSPFWDVASATERRSMLGRPETVANFKRV